MNPVKELALGLAATVLVHGTIVKRNMAYVWQVPYVPVAYVAIGCLIGVFVL